MPKVGRVASGKHTQSVLFRKRFWSKEESRKWLKKKEYKTDGYDQSSDFHRWRQFDPDDGKFRYRNDVIQENEGLSSIVLVLGIPKSTSIEEVDMLSVNEQLLQAIKARGQKRSEFGFGILTADSYVRTMASSIGSDFCRRYMSSDQMDFDDVLQKAAKTLVFSNDEMVVEEKAAKLPKGIETPKNTLMVFRHVLTTSQKDRDGDILRSDGAVVDPNMLLLWQHVPTLPIGKYLGLAKQNTKQLKVYSAIVDINELSHDAAVMVDNGMGRYSHGFRALRFSELKAGSDEEETTGFDIKEFEIMEESLVSVPANIDAETEEVLLSLVEGGKLTSPLMKERGKVIREHRAVVVPGIKIVEKVGNVNREITCNSFADLKAAKDAGLLGESENENESRSGSGEEGTETSTSEKADDDQEGSEEEKTTSDKEVEEKAKGDVGLYGAGNSKAKGLVSTGKVVKPDGWNPPSADKQNSYIDSNGIDAFAKWHLGKRDGVDVETKGAWAYPFTSDFKNVDRAGLIAIRQRAGQQKQEAIFSAAGKLVETIDKNITELSEKAGRALSKANEAKLRDAAESVEEALGMEDLPKAVKALLREIAGSLKAVLDSLGIEEEDKEWCIEDAMRMVIAEATPEQQKIILGAFEAMRNAAERSVFANQYEYFLKFGNARAKA